MNRLRRIRSKLWSAVTAPGRAAWSWWEPIPAEGKVAFIGLVLLGVGLQAALIGLAVPGLILTSIGMGFNLRRGS
jgi:hypothetical protein